MKYDIDVNYRELRDFALRARRAVNDATKQYSLEVWGNIMEFSPKDTGRLAGSWTLQQIGERQHLIATPVEYAAVQNDGSDPYMIYPRQAQALRFVMDGQVIFAKEVLHPGINGTHYIEGGIAAADNRLEDFVEQALAKEGLT